MKNFLFIMLMSFFALTTSTAQNGQYTVGVFSSGVNCETQKAYFDIKIKATDANSHFRIADANLRLSYNRAAFVSQSVFIESELGLSGPVYADDGTISVYHAHTTTGSLDTIISYNIGFLGGEGYPITETWTPVGRIGLDIVDINACASITFNDNYTFPHTFVGELLEGQIISLPNATYENTDICLSDYCNSGTSSCLPNGITLSTQKQIDDFVNDYPGCTEVTGDIIIEETNSGNILNLNGLNQITAIGGNLEIRNNAALVNLAGLESLTDLNGSLIVKNNTALDDLISLVNIDGTKTTDVQILNNTALAICHVKSICDHLSSGGTNTISGNATGCDDALAVSNACSANACPLVNITFTSQQQVDDFATNYPSCTQIAGYVNIDDAASTPITNLKGLGKLTDIGGTLSIQNNITLLSLSGLDNITSIGGLYIERNDFLTDLSGLDKLTTISKDVIIRNNDMLYNLVGLNSLTALDGSITIEDNDILNSLKGLDYLKTIGGNLTVTHNSGGYNTSTGLVSISHLNELVSVGGDIHIDRNESLKRMEFKKLNSIGGSLEIITQGGSLDANNLTTIGGNLELVSAYLRDFSGLTGLHSIGGDLIIQSTGLVDSSNLSNLQSISGKLFIYNNYSLSSLNGLHNIDPAGISDLTITGNYRTSVCALTNICTYLASGKPVNIIGNRLGCDTEAQVRAFCTSDANCDYNSTVSLFSDIDLYIDSKGFDNNPTMIFTVPPTSSDATFSDISLKLYFRVSANSCEDDIAIQITDPAGNTHPLKAYTTCDGGSSLRQITLDVPNSTATTNTGNWTVQFDDTNDQNSGDEYSVRYGKLNYTVEGSGGVAIPIQEQVIENEGKDINVSSGGFSSNPSVTVAIPDLPTDDATASNVEANIYFKVLGNSCENDIAIQVTTPEGYTFPLAAYSTCDGGVRVYNAFFDIPDTHYTDIVGDWLFEFDDTNSQNQTVEYIVKHVRLKYLANYTKCINALVDNNKDLNGSSLTDSNMKKQALSLDEDIQLYPVPTGQYLNIDYLSESKYPLSIEVMSNDGKSLMIQESLVQEGMNTLQLNVRQLPAGHYYLKMYSADKAPQMKSFVKVNQKQ